MADQPAYICISACNSFQLYVHTLEALDMLVMHLVKLSTEVPTNNQVLFTIPTQLAKVDVEQESSNRSRKIQLGK